MADSNVSASFKAPSLEEERQASEARLRELERRLRLADKKMGALENAFGLRQVAVEQVIWC